MYFKVRGGEIKMDKYIVKVLIWGGLVYAIISVFLNIEFTIHYNSIQYVPEGETRDPIRISDIIRDVISPIYQLLVLWGAAFIIKHLQSLKKQ